MSDQQKQKPDQENQKIRSYFDQQAGEYSSASGSGVWDFVRKRESRMIMEQLSPRPGELILDAGCGAGYYSELLLRSGANVEAADFSPQMVHQVRQRLSIPAIVCDLMEHQFEPKYDKVLCAGAFEFLAKPEQALVNLSLALKPDSSGRIVLHLPKKSWGGRLYRRFHKKHGFHVRLFTENDVHTMADQVGGLAIDTISTVTFNFVVSLYQR